MGIYMNDAVEKFKILDTFLKTIQQLDNNYFELSKDEIEKANLMINSVYTKLFVPITKTIKINSNHDDNVISTYEKDLTYIEEFEDLLKGFNISIDLEPTDAFDILDEFIYKFKKIYKDFTDNVRFRKDHFIRLDFLYSYHIIAVFDFQLNLISFEIDDLNFTEIINDKIPFNDVFMLHKYQYHRAFRNYHYLLKQLKIDLGIEKPVINPKKEVLVKTHYHDHVRLDKVTIKPDGYYSTKDLYSRNPTIVEATEKKKLLLEEYQAKIKEFEEWKKSFEKDLFNVTLDLVPLEYVTIDDDVYVSNKERLIKVKITKIEYLENERIFTFKKYNDELTKILRKEYSYTVKNENSLPFYQI